MISREEIISCIRKSELARMEQKSGDDAFRKEERFFFVMFGTGVLLAISLIIAVVYVAQHFIRKFW